MKRSKYILAALCALFVIPMHAQDFQRLSERTIMGTARYVGMSGAMSAIGGDPSAVLDNPAGLGLYQRSEVMLTFDETLDYSRQVGVSKKWLRSQFMCPQASFVLSLPTYSVNEMGVQSYNMMFSYRRMHSYGRTYEAIGTREASLGSILPSLDIPFCTNPTAQSNSLYLNELGYANEYSFDFSLNIGHRWYVGMGLHVQSFMMEGDAVYKETFDTINAAGVNFYNRNSSALQFSGVSCNLSVGLIYRPVKWLRLGIGLQTPTLGSLRINTSGTFSSQTDSLRFSYAPNIREPYKGFHMPLHVSSSVAFQIGAYGMISLQHDYYKQIKEPAVHSLRAGIEVIPIMGMYINAGYAYESTFSSTNRVVPLDIKIENGVYYWDRQDSYFLYPRQTQYASFAIGYRGAFFMVQAAYQYRWQDINLFAHEAVQQPYNMHSDTHRIVLTLAWHRN